MSEKPGSSLFDRLCRNVFDDAKKEDPPELRPTNIGRFRILEELGRGGAGVVWKAHDPTLDREVALKILPPTTSRADYERLLREARGPSRAPHPGIVKIHEIGEMDGRPFLVMDLIGGRPLSEIAKEPIRRKVAVFVQIAEALEHAHKQGVVHRDIKPSNILLTNEGRPVLVDFGLSRTIGKDERVTRTGAIFGTPYYMSPEQADGSPADVDARSDLYCLGVVMYELLSGQLPFRGQTPFGVMQQILTAEAPPLRDVPRELSAIVFKAMSKRKEDRYPSAGALAAELRAWLAGGAVKARAPSPLPRLMRRYALPSLGAAVLVAAGATLAIALRPEGTLANSVPIPIPARPAEAEPRTEPPRFEPHPWRAAARATLAGDAVEKERELARLRDIVARMLADRPKDMYGYLVGYHLDLLEGRDQDALQRLELALQRGLSEEEIRPLQMTVVIVTSPAFRVCDRPYRFDFRSLLKDERFVAVQSRLATFSKASLYAQQLERLLQEKDDEVARRPDEPRGKIAAAEIRLLIAIASYNMHRVGEGAFDPRQMLEDFPTAVVGAMVVLQLLASGRLMEAQSTLDQVQRLPSANLEAIRYLRAILMLEDGNFQEATPLIQGLENEKIRNYLLGLIEIWQRRAESAGNYFRACGAWYPAQFHLAAVSPPEGTAGTDLIYSAIKQSTAFGEYNMFGEQGPPTRFRNLQRTPSFFVLSRPVLRNDPILEALRSNPDANKRLKSMTGQ